QMLVAARRQLDHIARAAVGAELGETRDIGTRRQTAHALRSVGVRGVRARIAEAPESDHLGADQELVAVRQAIGCLEEHPGPVAAAQVTYLEPALLPRQLGVQWRHERVIAE